MIESRNNPRVKALASLATGKGRREQGLSLAEGLHLAQEALQSSADVRTLILSASALGQAAALALRAAAAARGVEVLEVSDPCYARISDLRSPEGAAVVLAPRNWQLGDLAGGDARVVAAIGVQDPGNAGAIVRVAEAAGAAGVAFVNGADPDGPKFLRASMGSAFRLACARCSEPELVEWARGRRMRLLATVPAAADTTPYGRARLDPPCVICLGSEGAGLPDSLLRVADERIHIPMAGPVESLNVAAAAAILLFK